MATTAAAYEAEEHVHECTECCEDEGIMPRKPVPDVKCPWCNGAAEYYGTEADLTGVHYIYVCLEGCGRFEV